MYYDYSKWGFDDYSWNEYLMGRSGSKHDLKGCQTNQINVVADTTIDVAPPKEKPRPPCVAVYKSTPKPG